MLYDISCDCNYIPLHCLRNKRKKKEKEKKNLKLNQIK